MSEHAAGAAQAQWGRFIAALLLASTAASTVWLTAPDTAGDQHDVEAPKVLRANGRTLVMYIFADTDPEFIHNLQYFIQEAIHEDDYCDYVIVVQKTGKGEDHLELPQLPSNAKYVFHSNECYDWGTFGWLLKSGHVTISKYTYFIFMNCSVRGPFFPQYYRGKTHWTAPFLSRINDLVKLVGPTISCEGSPMNGTPALTWRRNPHVQSYVAATDKVGLQVLLDAEGVFKCHAGRWDAIYHSELGSSAAILQAGYNIDSLMLRYQGVDWRVRSNWDCNARTSPANGAFYYDGVALDPYEVLFVKVKHHLLESEMPFTVQAIKYQQWQMLEPQKQRDDISGNGYFQLRPRILAEQALLNEARGSQCFDMELYKLHSRDLAAYTKASELWHHFLRHGQFENRPHRFLCDLDYEKSVRNGKLVRHKRS